MERERVKQELREMLEAETRILDSLISSVENKKEQKYICEKLFEIAEYIIALQDYLERTR